MKQVLKKYKYEYLESVRTTACSIYSIHVFNLKFGYSMTNIKNILRCIVYEKQNHIYTSEYLKIINSKVEKNNLIQKLKDSYNFCIIQLFRDLPISISSIKVESGWNDIVSIRSESK